MSGQWIFLARALDIPPVAADHPSGSSCAHAPNAGRGPGDPPPQRDRGHADPPRPFAGVAGLPVRHRPGPGAAVIEYSLDTAHSILHVRPTSALEAEDFVRLARAVDPHIEATGKLAGLIVEVTAFPGWESLGAMVAHFRFVRDHHRRVARIAVVTDSALGDVAERLASHFVSAEIRHFPAGEIEAARQWILGRP